MMLVAAGLTGTIPSAIADLSCAPLLTYVYAPGRASGLGRARTAPIRCDPNVYVSQYSAYCSMGQYWVVCGTGEPLNIRVLQVPE
jgi:hypothetical protein